MELDFTSAIQLEDAPWPATLEELLDYAERSGASSIVIEYLQERKWNGDEGEEYESLAELWPPYEDLADLMPQGTDD